MDPDLPIRSDRGGTLLRMSIAVTLVLLLPLAGVSALGKPLGPYLLFPPKTPDLSHAPFSLPVFIGMAILILSATVPIFHRLLLFRRKEDPRKSVAPFPVWGWAGAFLGTASWFLAWNRFPWMRGFQPHLFTPLWIGFILVVNALTVRKTGRCLLLSRTRSFLLLFPVSAGFWWSFEYLNRFVGNWRYTGVAQFGASEYFLFATLPFSTVLPAVLSTRELLLSSPQFDGAFASWGRRGTPSAGRTGDRRPGAIGLAALLLSCAGLFAVGIVPDAAFPLVWVAPPALLVSLAVLRGVPHALSGIGSGDWRSPVSSALAALLCGFFWELWNFGCNAKWVYDIPFVNVPHIFEMPLLGYAGYLPFGVLCGEIGDGFFGIARKNRI